MNYCNWTKWNNRNSINGICYPGIYCVCYRAEDISNQKFTWCNEIIYIGMTNSKEGLKGRLAQFDRAIQTGNSGHSGGRRVYQSYSDYESLVGKLYVSVYPFKCNVISNDIEDLLVMGDVAKQEYIAFAEYAKRYGQLPQFNKKGKYK